MPWYVGLLRVFVVVQGASASPRLAVPAGLGLLVVFLVVVYPPLVVLVMLACRAFS